MFKKKTYIKKRITYYLKVKIKYQLRQKQVSEYCIKKALAAIDDNDYTRALNKLAAIKLKSLKTEKNIFIKKKKLLDHLQQKGYEAGHVNDVVHKMLK